ncbi:MAG: VCBS repeat-containing protein [Acidobacteria bacterium]|nr:VCBS repeat-containing protein [Acidobacteriota bacterium]
MKRTITTKAERATANIADRDNLGLPGAACRPDVGKGSAFPAAATANAAAPPIGDGLPGRKIGRTLNKKDEPFRSSPKEKDMKRKITEPAIEDPKSKIRNRNLLLILIIAVVALGVFGTGMSILEQSAKDEMLARKNQNYKPSLLGRVNPFLPDPTPTPTPQLSKELIYAGQRLLAVEDANANAAPPADLAVWRPLSGVWWVLGANQQSTSQQWGLPADKPVPGDYDGDGKTDFAIFRSGDWWIMRSSDSSSSSSSSSYMISLGASGDRPAQADFDGDGRTDPAVYHEDGANGVWKILLSTTNQVYEQQYGLASDTPAPADYDGDGRADLAVRRESNNTFYSRNSSNSQTQSAVIGTTGDLPVPSDYDGDGRADYALFRPSDTKWYIRESSTQTVTQTQWGISGDKLVQNDYDGDGKTDLAVWRESTGTWYIRQSASNGALRQEQFGVLNDIPVPAFYRR